MISHVEELSPGTAGGGPVPLPPNAWFFMGISFLSAAALILEVSLTRILSVTQGYHFAFLIVSTALLGTGAAGAYLTLYLKRWPGRPDRWVVFAPLVFGLTSCSGYLVLNAIPFDVVRLAWDIRQIGYFLLAYLVLGVPFFFSGLTIVSAFLVKGAAAGRIYFADLSGAAIGAVLPLALFEVTDGAGIVIVSAGLGAMGGLLLWIALRPEGILPKALILLGLLSGLFFSYSMDAGLYELRLSPYRGLMTALRFPEAKRIDTRWNAVSRIDVVESPLARFAPGLSLTYRGELPPQLGLTIDGDQLQAITAYDGHDKRMVFLEHLPAAAAFVAARPRRVFIANPGGGLDVLMALYFGAEEVGVAEQNPILPSVVMLPAVGFPSRIYEDPRVRVAIGHERSLFIKSRRAYDLMVISRLQAFGAGGASIAEDYTFTVEAVADYLSHLSDGGWLSVSQYLEPQPVYAVRLMATAIEALEKIGADRPGEHMAVVRSWGTITLLVKRGKMTVDEMAALRQFAESRRFDLDYYPRVRPEEVNRYNRFAEPVYYRLFQQLLNPDSRKALYEAYPFQIKPATDDRPFFSYVLRWDRMAEIYSLAREKWLFLVERGLLVPVMLIQSCAAAAFLIVLPAWLRMRRAETRYGWCRGRVFAYFFFIALGFMWVEMAMIQRLILYLVHPVHAVSVVLACILLFAGAGSRISARAHRVRTGRPTRILAVLCLLILIEAILLPRLSHALLGLPLAGRFAVAVLALGPLGILMGMPFPIGMQRLKESGLASPVTWAWAINGSTSVVAVILAIQLAISVGLTGVMILAAMAYASAAWAAMGRWTWAEGEAPRR